MTKRNQTVKKHCIVAGILILLECFLAIHVHDQMYACEREVSFDVITENRSLIAPVTVSQYQPEVVLDAADGGKCRIRCDGKGSDLDDYQTN